MRIIKLICLGMLSLFLLSSPLLAGVYMSGIVKDDGKTENMEMYVQPDRMRFETMTDHGKQIVIYRDDLKKFWVVNDGKYMEMTEEDMKEMGQQMDEAMKKMEQQMQSLPPEQRKMMEKMMKGKMGEKMGMPQESKTEWEKIGSEKVKDWECTKYKSNDGKTVWTAQPEELGVTKNDFQVFEKAQDFFSEMMRNNDSFLKYTATDDSDGLSGFPVKTVSSDGREQILNEVFKKDFDSDLFELQKDWKKEDNPMMK